MNATISKKDNGDLFNLLLDEMQVYCVKKTTDSSAKFVPSTEPLRKLYNEAGYIELDLYTEDPVIVNLKEESKKTGRAMSDESSSNVRKRVQNTLGNNPTQKNFEDFEGQLNEIQKETEDQALAKIRGQFDSFRKAGKETPSLQKAILAVARLFSSLFDLAVEAVLQFFNELFENIVRLFKIVYKTISAFFSGLGETISGWFKSKNNYNYTLVNIE